MNRYQKLGFIAFSKCLWFLRKYYKIQCFWWFPLVQFYLTSSKKARKCIGFKAVCQVLLDVARGVFTWRIVQFYLTSSQRQGNALVLKQSLTFYLTLQGSFYLTSCSVLLDVFKRYKELQWFNMIPAMFRLAGCLVLLDVSFCLTWHSPKKTRNYNVSQWFLRCFTWNVV